MTIITQRKQKEMSYSGVNLPYFTEINLKLILMKLKVHVVITRLTTKKITQQINRVIKMSH